jgi:hypothetical protein
VKNLARQGYNVPDVAWPRALLEEQSQSYWAVLVSRAAPSLIKPFMYPTAQGGSDRFHDIS